MLNGSKLTTIVVICGDTAVIVLLILMGRDLVVFPTHLGNYDPSMLVKHIRVSINEGTHGYPKWIVYKGKSSGDK